MHFKLNQDLERIARRLQLLSILEQRCCLQLSQFMRGFFSTFRKNSGQRLQALREHSFDQLLVEVVPERQVSVARDD